MTETLPIPLHVHRKTCHHRMYRLSCTAFDALRRRAGDRCEICRVRAEDVQKRALYIDHDNRLGDGWNHVRGLLCSKCNSAMRYVDNGYRKPSPAQQSYLDKSWFWTGLAESRRDRPWLPDICVHPNHAVYRSSRPDRGYVEEG